MSRKIPMGVEDFRELRQGGHVYVDKSLFVRDLLDSGAKVTLLPRPRRFGKTLNLSMLRWFFEQREEDLSGLFQDLAIWRAGETYRDHFQKHPVISISFKGAKFETFDATWAAVREKIRALFNEHRKVYDAGVMTEWERGNYRAVLEGTADLGVYARSLLDLSALLHRHYGAPVVILVDEYDEPLNNAYFYGYLDEALNIFRPFMTETLKGNPHLFKGVVTGVLRVAREGIFSDLNNLDVCTLLNPRYRDAFGFTEPEVEALLVEAGLSAEMGTVRRWYNGYVFGGAVIYNPWSVLAFLQNGGRAAPYWVNTSSNDLVKDVLREHGIALRDEMEDLLQGRAVEQRLSETVALAGFHDDREALWSLLLFSGYLKAEEISVPEGLPRYRLSIPNLEVGEVYRQTFSAWLKEALRRRGGRLDLLLKGLLTGDVELFEEELRAFVTEMLSYHDMAVRRPEQVYQAFLVGLLAALAPDYVVWSNRESGRGRADVLIRPTQPGKPGVVLELKVARPPRSTLEEVLEEGLRQIREKGYAAELIAAGATPVHEIAVAFDGKEIRARGGGASADKAEDR